MAGTFIPVKHVFSVPGVLAAIIIGLTFRALATVLPSRQAAKLDAVSG